jgi:hypothetical protein
MVTYSSCIFHPDVTSPEATARGDGDLVIAASALGLAPGEAPPTVMEVERAPGVYVRFDGGGQLYYGTKFVGWTYWEEDATCDPGVTPYVNFKVLAE